jgi:urease accessory protein
MCGDAFPFDQAASGRLQRARGAVSLGFRRRGTATCLDAWREEGCLKARFPRPHHCMQVVMLNTSGGVAGGDRLRVAVRLAEATTVTIASQAAERFYRARDDDAPASAQTDLVLAAGSCLEWLPQEAILFDGCAVHRRLKVEMAASAVFLGAESLVFGRAAMGEQVRTARIVDAIEVWRDGALLLHDTIRMPRNVAEALARPAIAGGARAVATLVLVAPDAEARLAGLRAALPDAEAGASSWNGMLLARILAPDAAGLRRRVVAGLDSLRGGRPLPRTWLC